MTREDVKAFLLKHVSDEQAELFLTTPNPVFGDMTADKFAAAVGWQETIAVFRRIFG